MNARERFLAGSKLTDRQKITAWLAGIRAPKDEADEVLELCKADPEARAYYLKRHTQDCTA